MAKKIQFPFGAMSRVTSEELLGTITDESGTGSLVFNTSPTLVTPALGVATATSITIADGTSAIGATVTNPSATLENINSALTLTSASTYLTGDDITYSSARGSSILKLTGTYTGVNGGFSGIYSYIATSGAHTGSGAGVIGIKSVVVNTATMTDGNIYGAQFIAKHNHASATMANEAALIGSESIAYISGVGQAGTAIGANVVMRNYGTAAGSVNRGLQIILDQTGTKATEGTGICVWNMAGTWDSVLRVTGAFTSLINFVDATTCYATITNTPTTVAGQILVTMPNGNPGYIVVFSTTGT